MNKETLINRIEIMGTETSENYPHEQMVDREVVIKLVNQLDEPEKVIIPQFVAIFIEDSRNKVGDIITAIWEMYEYEYPTVYEWSLVDGNDEVLIQAFANGYEIEKEPLYYVKFIDNSEATYLNQRTYERTYDGTVFLSDTSENKAYKTKFTESEIKAIDERYLAFKVPVEGCKYDE